MIRHSTSMPLIRSLLACFVAALAFVIFSSTSEHQSLDTSAQEIKSCDLDIVSDSSVDLDSDEAGIGHQPSHISSGELDGVPCTAGFPDSFQFDQRSAFYRPNSQGPPALA